MRAHLGNAVTCLENYRDDARAFAALLGQCGRSKALAQGRRIHESIIQRGLRGHTLLSNLLIKMYIDCGSLPDAHTCFDSSLRRDLASWTSLIGGYAKHDNSQACLQLFRQMQWEGFEPNQVTFLSLLGGFSSPSYLEEGTQLHSHIAEKEVNLNTFLGSALIKMYGRCGALEDAFRLFATMPNRDLVVWNTIIAASALHACDARAVGLFEQMKSLGVRPDKVTFVSLLDSCTSPGALRNGQLIHRFIGESKCKSDIIVGNALIRMYSKCGSLAKAQQCFDEMPDRDVISWTVMIGVNSEYGFPMRSLMLFKSMQNEGVKPDRITFMTVIAACAQSKAIEEGKLIHAQLGLFGIELDAVIGTVLLGMYGECGCLEEANKVFNQISDHNVLSWTVMMKIYASCGQGHAALNLFRQMRRKKIKADKVTFISILEACADATYLPDARSIHSCIVDSGLEADILVANALITMYGKCGCLKDALAVFHRLFERDVVSYNSIITTCAQHGHGEAAFQLFAQMQHESVKPSNITLCSMLTLCSHAGLLDEGYQFFNSVGLNRDNDVRTEHYGCMIDILGRSGQLNLAEDFINRMCPCQNEVVWTSFLNGCRIHGDIQRAQHAVDRLLELDPNNSEAYLVLLSMYAQAGRWEDASKLKRSLMAKRLLGTSMHEC